KLVVLAVATEETDGFKRFMRSARVYGLNVEVLGMDEEWKGEDLIIMFVDSYDVIFMAGPEEILKRFHKTKSKVLFSAEGYCWPDGSLADKYPKVEKGKRFLNSGGFMGYAPYIYEIVTSSPLKDEEDDQLFYTKIYLDEDLRKKWSIKLDHKAEIFQNLMVLLVICSWKWSKQNCINSLGNYLAKSWIPKKNCLSCSEDTITLESFKKSAENKTECCIIDFLNISH
ncbi:multifunctional procollagen lysine hydroxylase and glycosyltransferase LH3, partial [Trichonephila clavata]